MKILSMENYQDTIEYSVKKDLLIPCWIYKVSIETSRSKQLNFLEETILNLINLDKSLSSEIDKLSSMLGFENKEIIQAVLKRLKHLNLSDIDSDDGGDTEVNIYIFYQEAYTGELLPIVTTDINGFSFLEKDKKFKENIYREISFKQSISSKKNLKAFLINNFSNRATKITKEDIIRTIYLHNKNNYDGFGKIDYQNFNIDLITTTELIYLHTKLFIPKSSPDTIVITNGFTNDYSTLFREIYDNQHQELISFFRDDLKQSSEKSNYKINVPFEKEIKNFPNVLNNVISIEKNLEKLETADKNKIKKFKEYIWTSLYDAIEKSFEEFTEDDKDTESLKDKKPLHELSKKAGFVLDTDRLPIFNVSRSNNLQKFLAKALFYKKPELYEVALKFPDFLYTLSDLFSIRNGLKHSQKEDTLTKIKDKDIQSYVEIIYSTISLILKVKQKKVQNNIDDDDDIYFQNSFVDLEKDLSIEVIKKLPQEIKDNLVSVNYYLNELDFESNKYNIVKETINQLYSSFEYILKNIVTTLYSNPKDIKNKKEIIDKIDENNLEITLLSVSPPNIGNAQSSKNASLGAYFLVYLYHQKEIDLKMINVVQSILAKRRHSTPTVEEVEVTTKKELQELKISSFKFIKKIIEEMG